MKHDGSMTETERLRALLDERGVPHVDANNATFWRGSRGEGVTAYIVDSAGGLLVKHYTLTAEQAVDATLGIEVES